MQSAKNICSIRSFLRKKSGRPLILFVEAYRDNGKSKHRSVERIGYLGEFTHLHNDPVAHF
jgi:hypothetical protein